MSQFTTHVRNKPLGCFPNQLFYFGNRKHFTDSNSLAVNQKRGRCQYAELYHLSQISDIFRLIYTAVFSRYTSVFVIILCVFATVTQSYDFHNIPLIIFIRVYIDNYQYDR